MTTLERAPERSAPPPEAPPRRRWRPLWSAVAVVVAVALHVVAQWSALVTLDGWSVHKFRNYFAHDQLSYLSYVVNGSHGRFGLREPFTGTGNDYYPHAYYAVLGLVSRVTGVGPIACWAICGLVVQAVLIAVLAAIAVRVGGTPWVALLAPVPFLVGTYSSFTGPGWYTQLSSHAVLWGGYGEMFALNGGAAALCVGLIGLLGLLVVALGAAGTRARALALGGSALVGAVADVQTYSFLTVVYFAAYVAAVLGLLRIGSRRRAVPAVAVSIALLATLLATGRLIGGDGSLSMLVLGLVPALPGLAALTVRYGRTVPLCLGVAALFAAPQVVRTVHGMVTGDPFLTYRVASHDALGVPWRSGLVAAATPAAVLLLVLAAGVHRRNAAWIAYAVGSAGAWALLASNDLWGADQEPYRLWLTGFVTVTVTLVPVTVAVGRSYLGADAGWRRRVAGLVGVAVCVAGVAAPARDVVRFWQDVRARGFIDLGTPQAGAMRVVLAEHPHPGIGLYDNCINPFVLKVASGADIAWFNQGMAWPAQEPGFAALERGRARGVLNAPLALRIGVRWVLTDASCPSQWGRRYATLLDEVGSARYGRGRITLWRLLPPSFEP